VIVPQRANYRDTNGADIETGLVGWRRSEDLTNLRGKFPANREFYREFCGFGLFAEGESLDIAENTMT
jgi:hypothetical protein